MRWEDNVNFVGLPVGIRRRTSRPSLVARVKRTMDRLITRTQEWLEGPDRMVDKAIAYGIMMGVLIFAVVSVLRMVLR